MRQQSGYRRAGRFIFAIGALAWGIAATGSPARADDPPPAGPPGATINLSSERDRIIEQVRRRDLSEAEVQQWIGFAEQIKQHAKRDLTAWERIERALTDPWVFFGFAAQGIFMLRFVVQLVASERKKRSHVPVAFWYLSVAGGLMLLVYALVRRDPVFVLGQGLGIVIYVRNLMLIRNRQSTMNDRLGERAERMQPAGAEGAETP